MLYIKGIWVQILRLFHIWEWGRRPSQDQVSPAPPPGVVNPQNLSPNALNISNEEGPSIKVVWVKVWGPETFRAEALRAIQERGGTRSGVCGVCVGR